MYDALLMSRAGATEALILRASRFGDYHKQLELLSPELGLLKAVAYGACKGKSRLVGTSDPYSSARIQLYRNPVKNQYKVSDIDVLESYEGIRAELYRSYAAALTAEVMIAAFAGGGPDYSYPYGLLRSTLRLLNRSDNDGCRRAVFQFLIRFLAHSGFLGYGDECARCGTLFRRDETTSVSLKDEGFCCSGCSDPNDPLVSPGMRRYMDRALELPLSRAIEIVPDGELSRGLVQMLSAVLDSTLQRKVRSFNAYFSFDLYSSAGVQS